MVFRACVSQFHLESWKSSENNMLWFSICCSWFCPLLGENRPTMSLEGSPSGCLFGKPFPVTTSSAMTLYYLSISFIFLLIFSERFKPTRKIQNGWSTCQSHICNSFLPCNLHMVHRCLKRRAVVPVAFRIRTLLRRTHVRKLYWSSATRQHVNE